MSELNELQSDRTDAVPCVNGVPIDPASLEDEVQHHGDALDPLASARSALIIRELLRQRGVALELIASDDRLDDATLDALLERELHVPTPTRDECLRYYENHPERFRHKEMVCASHILLAVNARTNLERVRLMAEDTLQQVLAAPDRFESLARSVSNCPSGGVGGSLGECRRGECVPEFDRALFGSTRIGTLPRLVNTRFGFHVVRIEQRISGELRPFEELAENISRFLAQRVRLKAMQQYVTILASTADIVGAHGEAGLAGLVQ